MGISLALMAFTGLCLGIHVCLHVCVCWRSIYIGADDEEPLVFVYFTKNSNPTFHPNYTDLYMMV